MYKSDASKFREIEHTADIGISARGDTLEEVFANAAFGMLNIIYPHPPRPASIRRSIELEESNAIDLLVRWLSEINYLLTVHYFLPVHILRLQIKQTGERHQLQALLGGSNSKRLPHEMRTEIKAVTYHQLLLKHDKQGYYVRIIFDI